ncbi:C13 family peptidase [Reyranella sp. CPCC 100927]|uniref:C13 family peptidase n=1 Tax=Reyranella sp. CPCC 100927 TaxID=2599616 RepID=UPI0015B6C016|nr:C13 family peptidase [Reyranella sp. CPCC 100927]
MSWLVKGCLAAAVAGFAAGCAQTSTLTAPAVPAAQGSTSLQPATWKALLVAADDAQPVFSNAVDALRERLMAFGLSAGDISVLKADSSVRDAVADRRNIERQRERLAGPPGAGCFVFITSHGYPRGGLVVARSRAVIGPGYLDQLLDQACGERPTVVVASGCFSGVYTADRGMRRPNRVILAAARSDLPSFGCGAQERYTYYDRCFLESLRRGAPWQSIVDGIRVCVDAQERRRGDPASHPQAFIGGGVAQLTAF